jgi:hypothetical protein
MPLPESFIQHLRDFGYHPRSDKHSNSLAAAIVQDLLESCVPIASEARSGRLVYDLNMDLRFRTATWNVDLVLGTPARPVDTRGAPIARATPATVRIALEIKGVMTEHRKAVKNRKRDFEAHHEHVHNYNRRAIAAGVMVVNGSRSFRSPLRPEPTIHGSQGSATHLVEHCITEMRNVTESGGGSDYGMDAKCALVVDFDNIDLAAASYVSVPPAPQPGDPLHYDSFVQRLCGEYGARFA